MQEIAELLLHLCGEILFPLTGHCVLWTVTRGRWRPEVDRCDGLATIVGFFCWVGLLAAVIGFCVWAG